LVTTETADRLVLTALLVTPVARQPNPVAVLWIHGASENFYLRSYVNIARETAARGYAFVSANTRMHDIGSVVSYRPDLQNRRGGTYWGIPSRQTTDIAAWVDFLASRNFGQVVIVGHSAGGPAVRQYQVDRNDSRVLGVVMASVSLNAGPPASDPALVATAERMVGDGRGQQLLQNASGATGVLVSAATYLDYAQAPPESRDFYGVNASTMNPLVRRLRVPLLAWFGTRDVGTAGDLIRLKEGIERHGEGPARVDTRILDDADHNYDGQERQVAVVLTGWIDDLRKAR